MRAGARALVSADARASASVQAHRHRRRSRSSLPFLLVSLLAVALASLPACSPADCQSLCEDTEFCPSGEDVDTCVAKCRDTETTARNATCADQFQSFLDCADSADDVCAQDSCVVEAQAYVACASDHCEKNPSEPGCTPPTGRACDNNQAEATADGCVVQAYCTDGHYVLTCASEACTCTKDGAANGTPAYQADFCAASSLDARIGAARAACGWPAQ